ncbi:MAG: GYF domain-containing protein [Desulfuromonadaceae bacterium]|nr:GYF domain-containing protein [Desulfuromonadaceae bacterium]MDD2853909.1 GYF domain-containing protein [Desulfuromonadaceae bacterium]
MALIPCRNCGHNISSLARFCPKCSNANTHQEKRAPHLVVLASQGEIRQTGEEKINNDVISTAELLLQKEFKPSSDEIVLLKGEVLLIRAVFNTLECYAYLTSTRFVLCDNSQLRILFQTGTDKIVFAEEGRHLISKKIVVTLTSGESLHLKCDPQINWLTALSDPTELAEETRKRNTLSNQNISGIDWFYEETGRNIGPIKEKNIVQLILNNHTIFPETKVWNASLTEWKKADDTILTIYFKEKFSPHQVIGVVDSVRRFLRKHF